MITAVRDGRYAFATVGARGTCPDCLEPVIAKCGEIVRAHWAHRPDADCPQTDRSPRRGYGWLVNRRTFIDGMLNGYGLTPGKPPFQQRWDPQAVTDDPRQIIPTPRDGSDDRNLSQLDQPRAPDLGHVLDWRDHYAGDPRPCVICHRPALMRNAAGRPCHKACAEEQVPVSRGVSS